MKKILYCLILISVASCSGHSGEKKVKAHYLYDHYDPNSKTIYTVESDNIDIMWVDTMLNVGDRFTDNWSHEYKIIPNDSLPTIDLPEEWQTINYDTMIARLVNDTLHLEFIPKKKL